MTHRPDNINLEISEHWPVVVIGAGVAGAMAALLCSRAGLQTLLVERQTFPRHKVCGCCLNAVALAELERAGILPRTLAPDRPLITSTRFYLRGHSAAVSVAPGLAVSRRTLDQTLVQAAVAAGCCFQDNTAATVIPADSSQDPQPGRSRQATRLIELRVLPPGSDSEAITPPQPGPKRQSTAGPAVPVRRISANVVLVADGLGHPSLHRHGHLKSVVTAGSRIGLGTVIPRYPNDAEFDPSEIRMAVSRDGYAGLVLVEDNQFNIAAAVDATYLQQQGSPAAALMTLFRESGLPAPAALADARPRGTLPLTQSVPWKAELGMFLLGDATGYVEPFTGEGIAWALLSASAVVPLVQKALGEGWSDNLVAAWHTTHRQQIGNRQRLCRLLVAGLRRPWLLRPLHTACRWFPSIGTAVFTRTGIPAGRREFC